MLDIENGKAVFLKFDNKVKNFDLRIWKRDESQSHLILAEYFYKNKRHLKVIPDSDWNFQEGLKDLEVKIFNFSLQSFGVNLDLEAKYFKEMGYILEKKTSEDDWIIVLIFIVAAIICLIGQIYIKLNHFWWNQVCLKENMLNQMSQQDDFYEDLDYYSI